MPRHQLILWTPSNIFSFVTNVLWTTQCRSDTLMLCCTYVPTFRDYPQIITPKFVALLCSMICPYLVPVMQCGCGRAPSPRWCKVKFFEALIVWIIITRMTLLAINEIALLILFCRGSLNMMTTTLFHLWTQRIFSSLLKSSVKFCCVCFKCVQFR